MVEGDRPRGSPQENGATILQTGVDVQSQKQTKDKCGDESQPGHEF